MVKSNNFLDTTLKMRYRESLNASQSNKLHFVKGFEDGKNVLQTAIYGLDNIAMMVDEMLDLLDEAHEAGHTHSPDELTHQYNRLLQKLNKIAQNASYKYVNLVDSEGASQKVEISWDGTHYYKVDKVNCTSSGLDLKQAQDLDDISKVTKRILQLENAKSQLSDYRETLEEKLKKLKTFFCRQPNHKKKKPRMINQEKLKKASQKSIPFGDTEGNSKQKLASFKRINSNVNFASLNRSKTKATDLLKSNSRKPFLFNT